MTFVLFNLLRRAIELPVRLAWLLHAALISVLGVRVLGWLRTGAILAAVWCGFVALVAYVWAPLAGALGQAYWAEELDYFDQRSRGVKITDAKGLNVGIFSPSLEPDFLAGSTPVELPDYTAYPDHKTIPVDMAPGHFWACLRHQEDRYLGTWRNPFGIDFVSTLKMPVTLRGGSTLSMQLARMYRNAPPSAKESIVDKIRRKVFEWGLGPVIHWKLVRAGELGRFERWAANHLPMIQRHGGGNLYGIGLASEILFGRTAKDLAEDQSALSVAQQYVLAAAVNQPVGLLRSESASVESIRVESWRRIAGERAQVCREALLGEEPVVQREVARILGQIAAAPPEPKLATGLAVAASGANQSFEEMMAANPLRRAVNLAWDLQLGAEAEMRERFGRKWREGAQEVRLTVDVAANVRLRRRIKGELERLQKELSARINPAFTLVPGKTEPPLRVPDVVVAAADRDGRLVRYFEMTDRASYFGSAHARRTGLYEIDKESRAVASAAKLLAAIAIANRGADAPETPYGTARPCGWPCGGGEGNCSGTAQRAFSRSLNAPIMARLERLDLASDLERLAASAGFNRTDAVTPMTTATVCGYLGASPRTVHRLAGLILAALTGRGEKPMPWPSLIADVRGAATATWTQPGPPKFMGPGTPASLPIALPGVPFLRSILSGPLCERADKGRGFTGTLRRLGTPGALNPRGWCAAGHPSLTLHFAKTGSYAKEGGTIDLWTAGGVAFKDGTAYSYVVLVGTGGVTEPWGSGLGAGYVTAPLINALLEELAPPLPATDIPPSARPKKKKRDLAAG